MDALSRLQLINYSVTESDITREKLAEIYGVDHLEGNAFPLTYGTMNKYQRKDKKQVEKKYANYHTNYFHGGANTLMLFCKNNKIVVPTIFQNYVDNWYHTYILQPRKVRTEATISQH